MEHSSSSSPLILLSSLEDLSHSDSLSTSSSTTGVMSVRNSSGTTVQTSSGLIMELSSDAPVESGLLGIKSIVETSEQTHLTKLANGVNSEHSVDEVGIPRQVVVQVSGDNSAHNAQVTEEDPTAGSSTLEDPPQLEQSAGNGSNPVELQSEMPQFNGILTGMMAKLEEISTTLGNDNSGLVGCTHILETTLTDLYKYVHVKKTGLSA